MLNLVVSIVFKLISIIGGILLVPIITILKPFMDLLGFSDFVSYILQYIDIALTYFSFFAISLHIPLAPLLFVVSICGVLLTFTIAFRSVIMVKSVYSAIRGSSGSRSIGFDTSSK